MKVGDLVNFHTDAWIFERAKDDYVNPGVILQVAHDPKNPKGFVAEVYWTDGRVTREHHCYLQLVTEAPSDAR